MTGETRGAGTLTLVYDAQDRVEQATKSGLDVETYAYDHKGRRIPKTVGADTTQYLYSGMSIWSEYDATWSQALAHYTYTGLDQPVIRRDLVNASSRYYHLDGLGSPVSTTNAAGDVVDSQRYDAWGNVSVATSAIPRYGFTGRELDDTGLMFYRARYYGPETSRFISRDRLGFADGVNRYTYTANSPVNFTDPSGHVLSGLGALTTAASVGAGSSVVTGYLVRGNMALIHGGDVWAAASDPTAMTIDAAFGVFLGPMGAMASAEYYSARLSTSGIQEIGNAGREFGAAEIEASGGVITGEEVYLRVEGVSRGPVTDYVADFGEGNVACEVKMTCSLWNETYSYSSNQVSGYSAIEEGATATAFGKSATSSGIAGESISDARYYEYTPWDSVTAADSAVPSAIGSGVWNSQSFGASYNKPSVSR